MPRNNMPGAHLRHRIECDVGSTASIINPRNISALSPTNSNTSTGVIPSLSGENETTNMLGPNQFKSNWMLGTDLIRNMERGDLIEIRRGTYTHWVVYIGRFDDIPVVAHISTNEIETPTKKELQKKILKRCGAMVRSDPFTIVAGTDSCRINNSLDLQRRPFPPSVIVERAINKLGTGGYHIVQNNCEHFAKWCRYALRESDQSLIGQAGAIGIVSLVATTSLPYGLACGTFGFMVLKTVRAVGRKYIMRSII